MQQKKVVICEELFETHDEKPTNSFLYSLVMDTYSMGYAGNTYTEMPINHKVFLAQFDAIKKIADEGPCVLVGRCAIMHLNPIQMLSASSIQCRYGRSYSSCSNKT